MLWQPVKAHQHNSTHYETDRVFILETWDLDGKKKKKKNHRLPGIRYTAPFLRGKVPRARLRPVRLRTRRAPVRAWAWGVPEMGVHHKIDG